MRGFELILKPGKSLPLSQLFMHIDFSGYCFNVIDQDVYRDAQSVPHSDRFLKAVLKKHMEQGNAWILQMVLQIFPADVEFTPIDYYSDYQNSLCQMMLLVYDVTYIEVYTKNPDWLSQLLENAKQLPVVSLEIKTDLNDPRTQMWV